MSEQEGMSLEEFFGHRATARKGSQTLYGWKKRTPPQIDTFMHCRSKIAVAWQHGIPLIVEYDDKKEGRRVQKVFSDKWNCWEDELILQSQYDRDDDTGRRLKPPVICPQCLLQEWVYEQIAAGELKWTQPMFRYEARDTQEKTLVRAGGLINLFSKKNMSDREQEELNKAHVSLKVAWKENALAKLNYVFSVVDYSAPGEGVKIAIEAALLGDKVREVMHKRMKSAGDEEGNPFKNPYCIRWIHQPSESDLKKKYDAMWMEKIKPTDEILRLIRDTEPPSYRKVLARRNPYELRAQLEEHCLLPKGKVPWDKLFDRACKWWDKNPQDGTGFDASQLEGAGESESPKGEQQAAPEEDWVCEGCGELVGAKETVCPSCQEKKPGGDNLPY